MFVRVPRSVMAKFYQSSDPLLTLNILMPEQRGCYLQTTLFKIILQTTFSNAFSCCIFIKFSPKFVPRVTVGNMSSLVQATGHYLNRWWHSSVISMDICACGTQYVNTYGRKICVTTIDSKRAIAIQIANFCMDLFSYWSALGWMWMATAVHSTGDWFTVWFVGTTHDHYIL